MKKSRRTLLKDCLIGFAYGTACLIPGIAGSTILLITNTYNKVSNAVADLLSKRFWRNLVVLLPFGICSVLAFLALVVPIGYALDYCMFAIICLFVGLILGSLPTITDKVKGTRVEKKNIITLIICFLITTLIGVLSVIFHTSTMIEELFSDVPFYLYLIMLAVGFISATGLIVPGFSGSLLLLTLCFYEPILQVFSDLFALKNIGPNIGLLACFVIGTLIGFIVFSKIMTFMMDKHKIGTYWASIGLICGSVVAVFVNSNMFGYIQSSAFGLVDQILGPILLIVGFILGYLFVRYLRKHPEFETNA